MIKTRGSEAGDGHKPSKYRFSKLLFRIWDRVPLSRRGRWLVRWVVSNHKFIVGAIARVHDSEGRVLLFKHSYANPHPWGLPGTIVRNEYIVTALQKRIEEESGFRLAVNHLRCVIHGERRVDLLFDAEIIEGEFRPSPGVEAHGFFRIDDFDHISAGAYPTWIISKLASDDELNDIALVKGPKLTYLDFLLDQPDLESYSDSAENGKEVENATKEHQRKGALKDAYKAAYAAAEIAKRLPPGGEAVDFRAISFDPQYEDRGLIVVFTHGSSIGTKDRGVLLVPQRTRRILKELDIPFHEVDPS